MPDAPGLAAIAGDARIRIWWEAVDGVRLYAYRWIAGGVQEVGFTSDTRATITGLVNGQSYELAVRAIDYDGIPSEWSATVRATPLRVMVSVLTGSELTPENTVPREELERLVYAQAPDNLEEMLLFYRARGEEEPLEAVPMRYLSRTSSLALITAITGYTAPPADFDGDFSNRPGATFFEQRLIVGGGPRRHDDEDKPDQSASITGSKRPDETTGANRYYNLGARAQMDAFTPPDAFNFTMDEPFEIRWLTTYYNYLVLGTNLGIWLVRGLDPSAAPDSRMLSRIGANHVRPLTILSGTSHTGAGSISSFVGIVWVGVQGKRIYMTPGDRDLTMYAEHLFTAGVKELHWQKEPENRLWALMRDGTVAVLQMRGDVSGWSRITTARPVVSMCVQPGYEGADEVWALMEWNDIPRRHAICRLGGRHNLDMSTTATVRAAGGGRPVHVEVSAHVEAGSRMRAVDATLPPYVWYDAAVRTDDAGAYLPLEADVLVVENDRGIATSLPIVRGTDISDLTDLVVACDPKQRSTTTYPLSVSPEVGTEVTVGFPYSAQMELPQIAQLEGIAYGQAKRVSRATLWLPNSTGGAVGPTETDMEPVQRDEPGFERSQEVAIEPPDGGVQEPRRSLRVRYGGPGRFELSYLVAEMDGG